MRILLLHGCLAVVKRKNRARLYRRHWEEWMRIKSPESSLKSCAMFLPLNFSPSPSFPFYTFPWRNFPCRRLRRCCIILAISPAAPFSDITWEWKNSSGVFWQVPFRVISLFRFQVYGARKVGFEVSLPIPSGSVSSNTDGHRKIFQHLGNSRFHRLRQRSGRCANFGGT